MKLTRNVGPADRIVRLVIGASLLAFAALGLFPGAWTWIAVGAGLASALTGVLARCPLYTVLRLSGTSRG